MIAAVTSLLLAIAPITLVVRDSSGAEDPALLAAIARALQVDGQPVLAGPSRDDEDGVRLIITAQGGGGFRLEARQSNRVATDELHLGTTHFFEQARTLALQGLALVTSVNRPTRASPAAAARPRKTPKAEVPPARTPGKPPAEPSPPTPVPPAASEDSPPLPAIPPAPEIPPLPAIPPFETPPLPAIPSPPEIPPLPAIPPPEPTSLPEIHQQAPQAVRASVAPWKELAATMKAMARMPENPHLGITLGGLGLWMRGGNFGWTPSFFAAARVVLVKGWEMKLRVAPLPAAQSLDQSVAQRNTPIDLVASRAVPRHESLRFGAGFEGTVLERYHFDQGPGVKSSDQRDMGFSPGVVLEAEYRWSLGRFALSTTALLAWHPWQGADAPLTSTGSVTYPEWTAGLAIGLDTTIW